jgi:hypothetical protein
MNGNTASSSAKPAACEKIATAIAALRRVARPPQKSAAP